MSESAPEQRKRANTTETMTERRTALAEIDWRLLQWLLRYPLQRADDLVVGVSHWASRATVYRHMQELVEHGLVEQVLPKTPGAGKWLYYLSNLGLHVLAVHLDRPAGDLTHRWHADELGLLHVLPRLSTLLLLQDVVNGLVTQTAEAMTTQGRRPHLVRWTWQREVTHGFQYRDQPMRFFADGAMALCLRPHQSDGSTGDQWYGLFLLFTELDDERLMRLRLERLLSWRESSERWPVRQCSVSSASSLPRAMASVMLGIWLGIAASAGMVGVTSASTSAKPVLSGDAPWRWPRPPPAMPSCPVSAGRQEMARLGSHPY
jgi:predicted transcriptional regulator